MSRSSPPLTLLWLDPASGQTRKMPLEIPLRLGSLRQQNDVVLPFAGVHVMHAGIVAGPEGGWEIVALGVPRLEVNGSMVSRAQLRPGTLFKIGIVEFTVGTAAGSPAATAPSRPRTVPTAPTPPRPPRPTAATPPTATAGKKKQQILVAAAAAGFALVSGLALVLIFSKRSPRPSAAAQISTSVSAPAPAPAPVLAPGAATPASAAPAPADSFEAAKKAVVTVIAKLAFDKGYSTGTGFFVRPNGQLVTNFHVVKRTDFQQILLRGSKKPIDARILATDEAHDLALLQAYVTPPVPVAPLSRLIPRMGDTIFALGSPAGPLLEMSLSKGIVSADKPRLFGEVSFIQHDASINPGNSGGPLLDQQGRVVGVNTLKIREMQGLNFAITADELMDFLETNR